jgi:hypothetical protein
MRSRMKNIASVFHGALEKVAQGIHKRPSAKKCAWPLTFDTKNWRPVIFLLWPIHKNSEVVKHKNICVQPLLELLNSKFKSSKTCWVQVSLHLAPNGASKFQAWKLHHICSIGFLCLAPFGAFKLQVWKLHTFQAQMFLCSALLELLSSNFKSSTKSRTQKNVLNPFVSFQALSSKAPTFANHNGFCIGASLSF